LILIFAEALGLYGRFWHLRRGRTLAWPGAFCSLVDVSFSLTGLIVALILSQNTFVCDGSQ
jgi:hypothetical protein